jgi:predicted RNase H-like HicB family nuclease
MPVHTFTAIVHREGNLYVAECPEVGTVSQGHTIDEAIANLQEATALYLEEFPLPEVSPYEYVAQAVRCSCLGGKNAPISVHRHH